MRILLAEDSRRLSESIKIGLERKGFSVDVFETLMDSRAAIESVQYDAIILDLGLPDGEGLDLLKDLHNAHNMTPVLILTARDRVDERVHGLNAGSDDYVLKPVALEELVARLRALLRHPGGALGQTLTAGNISFDTSLREVCIKERPIKISRREMSVLEQLMRRFGRVVAKNVLEERLYGFEAEVTSNSLEVHISRLRKRLNSSGATTNIHTLRGVGYLLSEENK
jgi:DNA-binding response OmpR family regulator